jgi:hypothetical protein
VGANLESIGSSLRSAYAGAATQTTAIAAPAADEVSAAITSFFGTAGQKFQALSAQAAAFHDSFVSALSAGAGQYVSAEASNVQQTLANAAAAQSFPTPFGNISFNYGGSLPPGGQNGPFSGWVDATTPLGNAYLGINGNVGNGPSGPGTQYTVTGGTLNCPALGSLLSASTVTSGPAVGATSSLVSTLQTVVGNISQGNLVGAATALASAPGNFANSVLFGTTYLSIPLDGTSFGGPTVTVNVPYPGLLAGPQPITVSWPGFDYTSGGTTYSVTGNPGLALSGTQIPGAVPAVVSGVTGAGGTLGGIVGQALVAAGASVAGVVAAISDAASFA